MSRMGKQDSSQQAETALNTDKWLASPVSYRQEDAVSEPHNEALAVEHRE